MKHSLKHPLKTDMTSQAFMRDPLPRITALRAEGAVVPIRVPLLGAIWVTTTHETAEAALKQNDLFVVEGENAGKKGTIGLQWWMPKSIRILAMNMLSRDEPEHRRLRRLVDKAFARRGILDMRGEIEKAAARLLDRASAQAGGGTVDMVYNYARQLPIDVISDLLGASPAPRAELDDWAGGLDNISNPLTILKVFRLTGRLMKTIRAEAASVRAEPKPGLISELVIAEEDGDRLSEDELVAMVFILLFAGFETTTNLISGAVLALEEAPVQKAWWLEDTAGRTERAVEELTRFVSSVQATKPRYVARDAEFFGQSLKRGEKFMAMPLAANFDPAVFKEPHVLNLDRFPNPHLSFATGVHFCLGQQLARLETQIALTALYQRFPGLRLAEGWAPDYYKRFGTRALKNLHVRLA